MKAKLFYLLIAVLLFFIGSCSKEESDDKKPDCGCEQQQKAPENTSRE
jgi:PBP1b-binding outer membrane lipoprotein LpoB